ncbi:MAG: cytidine deaminase [Rhodoblastus sp.]|nr:MAG: cytidine deaminase [Rhodoblastus sp.]
MPSEAEIDRLFHAAKAAQAMAHAPYSGFRVGAAVLGEDGAAFAGCNVENAAYPLGACAEAGALSAFVLAGGRRLRAALVLGEGEALTTPCGGCRQRLREFASPDAVVLVAGPQGVRARFTLEALLPASFGPDNLAPTRGPR